LKIGTRKLRFSNIFTKLRIRLRLRRIWA